MNSVVVTLCVLFALAVLPAPVVRGVLATAAGSLFEATPFILAGMAAAAVVKRYSPRAASVTSCLSAYLGCGCTAGPSARSLPAAAATAMVFGPAVAAARLAGAAIVAHCLPCDHRHRSASNRVEATFASQLNALLPAALLSAMVAPVFTAMRLQSFCPPLQWLVGAMLGFVVSPCALGVTALASSLHARAPLAALGLLCTAGIIDARAIAKTAHAHGTGDAATYAVAAVSLAMVAARGGDALVHPRFVVPLACAAVVCLALAALHRRSRDARAILAPALMLCGALAAAPPPTYSATESTLTSLFVGEHLTFTGQIVHGYAADALVRFAITCCRADASPVVVRLARRSTLRAGVWVRADGSVVRRGDYTALEARVVAPVPPPSDPFVYW